MKLFKYLAVFVLIIGLGIAGWLYYPKYQILKMQRQAVEVNSHVPQVSYINYFKKTTRDELYHLAIGDSIVRGVGALKNENFVYQMSTKLEQETNKKIHFQNEGINGITSTDLNELVQEGRFDEEIKKADIVTINVGGNDLLRAAKKQSLQTVIQTFSQLQSDFSKNLTDIAAKIHSVNPDTVIIFLELYNPLSPDDSMYALADPLLPKWNLKIYEVAKEFPASIVVETTKVINGKHLDHLSPDGVHPNSAGYTAISEQILYQLGNQYLTEQALASISH